MSSSSKSFAYSSSSYSTSTSSSTGGSNQQSHSQSYTEQSHSNSRDGTTTQRRYEETGKPTVEETTHTPTGRQLGGSHGDDGRRIEHVTDEEQRKRDEEYEERMEDEYAKREGGA